MKRRMELLHDPAQVIAFVTLPAVAAGTPGPSNTLLTAVGARAGIRHGLASLFGQVPGWARLFAITLGLGNLLLAHPLALEALKWSGALMLCRIAWRIATVKPAEPARERTAGFLGMAAFQWVNPKGVADRRRRRRYLPGPARRRCPGPSGHLRDPVHADRRARLFPLVLARWPLTSWCH